MKVASWIKHYNKQSIGIAIAAIYIIVFATACQNKNINTINRPFNDKQEIVFSSTTSLSILAQSIIPSQTIVATPNNLLVGHLVDANFGVFRAGSILQFSLPFLQPSFPEDEYLVDSVVLVLAKIPTSSVSFFGDPTQSSYNIRLRQVKEALKLPEDTYTSDYNYQLYDHDLANLNIQKFGTADSVLINNFTSAQSYTREMVFPQLRIPLDTELALNQIVNAPTHTLALSSNFREHLNGFLLEIQPNSLTKGIGSAIYFDQQNSSLEVYYSLITNSTIGSTTLERFPLFTDLRRSTIFHDYSNTPIAKQLENPALTHTQVFIQSNGGVEIAITIGNLNALRALENIAIVHAELVIKPNTDTSISYVIPTSINLFEYDSASRRRLLVDATAINTIDFLGRGSLYGGNYNQNNNEYKFNLTNYIQSIIEGEEERKTIYATATDETNQLSLFSTYNIVSGIRIDHIDTNISLKIFYVAQNNQ